MDILKPLPRYQLYKQLELDINGSHFIVMKGIPCNSIKIFMAGHMCFNITALNYFYSLPFLYSSLMKISNTICLTKFCSFSSLDFQLFSYWELKSSYLKIFHLMLFWWLASQRINIWAFQLAHSITRTYCPKFQSPKTTQTSLTSLPLFS